MMYIFSKLSLLRVNPTTATFVLTFILGVSLISHTITADDYGLFDTGPISPGGKFDNAFDSTGVFGYHCSIHPFMRASVIVN